MNNNVRTDPAEKKRRKVYMIAIIICSAAVTVLALLQLLGVFPNAGEYYLPIIGVIMILQACNFWKDQRGAAIFSLCAALFILLCYAAGMFLK